MVRVAVAHAIFIRTPRHTDMIYIISLRGCGASAFFKLGVPHRSLLCSRTKHGLFQRDGDGEFICQVHRSYCAERTELTKNHPSISDSQIDVSEL